VVSRGFLADPNETRRIRPGMPVLLNQLRLLAQSAAFCVAWFNAAASMPAEALSRTEAIEIS